MRMRYNEETQLRFPHLLIRHQCENYFSFKSLPFGGIHACDMIEMLRVGYKASWLSTGFKMWPGF